MASDCINSTTVLRVTRTGDIKGRNPLQRALVVLAALGVDKPSRAQKQRTMDIIAQLQEDAKISLCEQGFLRVNCPELEEKIRERRAQRERRPRWSRPRRQAKLSKAQRQAGFATNLILIEEAHQADKPESADEDAYHEDYLKDYAIWAAGARERAEAAVTA